MKISALIPIFTILLTAGITQAAETPRTGTFSTHFESMPRYASARTIMQRMMLGDVYRSSVIEARNQGVNLDAFTIAPAEETWDMYVPADYAPDAGYGVLVWIPDTPAAEVPDSWKNVFEKHKLIYIAPRQAGKDQPILERRIPLALTGLNGILHDYRIDPARIYVGGSGGGAALAGNLALGFPDVFQGAAMLSGGPYLGTQESIVPPKSLLDFARGNRYAFAALRSEAQAKRIVLKAAESFGQYCILNNEVITYPAPGDMNLLDTALGYISTEAAETLANDCNAELAMETSRAVAKVKEAVENLPPDEALQIWQKTYLEYGGLVDEQLRPLKEKIEAKKRQRTPSTSLTRD